MSSIRVIRSHFDPPRNACDDPSETTGPANLCSYVPPQTIQTAVRFAVEADALLPKLTNVRWKAPALRITNDVLRRCVNFISTNLYDVTANGTAKSLFQVFGDGVTLSAPLRSFIYFQNPSLSVLAARIACTRDLRVDMDEQRLSTALSLSK